MKESKLIIDIEHLKPWQEFMGIFHSIIMMDDEPIVVFGWHDNPIGIRIPLTDFVKFRKLLRKNVHIGILRTDEDYRIREIKENRGYM